MPAFLTSVSVVRLGGELSLVNMELSTLWAVEAHRNAWIRVEGLPVALLKLLRLKSKKQLCLVCFSRAGFERLGKIFHLD